MPSSCQKIAQQRFVAAWRRALGIIRSAVASKRGLAGREADLSGFGVIDRLIVTRLAVLAEDAGLQTLKFVQTGGLLGLPRAYSVREAP